MPNTKAFPKEGDLYKTITIDQYVFELRYGYYEEADRAADEPVVIYPDFSTELYTKEGHKIVSAVCEACPYAAPDNTSRDKCCVDCSYYTPPGEDIGVCLCPHGQNKQI